MSAVFSNKTKRLSSRIYLTIDINKSLHPILFNITGLFQETRAQEVKVVNHCVVHSRKFQKESFK